jgi:hypothetical protein
MTKENKELLWIGGFIIVLYTLYKVYEKKYQSVPDSKVIPTEFEN